MVWYFNNKEFVLSPETTHNIVYGFVYLIENLLNGKQYIGKKFFWKKGFKTVKKKKKRAILNSDWMKYYGSNNELKNDVILHGKKNFKRTILHICKTKTECSYFETKEILTRDAILDTNYYNSWVSCRINKRQCTWMDNNNEKE